MYSSLTIDGVTIHGNVDFIRSMYETISDRVIRGESGDYAVGRTEGDYTIRTVFCITPSTAVSVELAFSPVDEVPERFALPS